MRMRSTTATVIWMATSLVFFYITMRYYVSDARSVPSSSGGKLWLQRIIGDSKVALTVQDTIGEKASQNLAESIDRNLLAHSCTIPDNSADDGFDTPTIYIVTATFRRAEQHAELTRLAQTLMHVDNICWLVIEDAKEKSEFVSSLLNRTGIRHVYLTGTFVAAESTKKKYTGRHQLGGVGNRNRGLEWIRGNADDGVLYFADDDNTYDLELFKEMRYTKKVSMWPVGLVAGLEFSSPIVKNGEFAGFYDGWIIDRKFPVDMACFAVNVKFLKTRPNAKMEYIFEHEEDSFLRSLAPFEPHEIELKADNCTKILVWHTQTIENPAAPPADETKYVNTNIVQLRKLLHT